MYSWGVDPLTGKKTIAWKNAESAAPTNTTFLEVPTSTSTPNPGSSVSSPSTRSTIQPIDSGSSTVSPSSTSSPIQPSASSPNNNGLATGAVAGVAIGCFFAGALIAAVLAWFFTKRKKPQSVRDSEASATALMHQEKGPIAKTVSLHNASPVPFAMEGLSQPLEDKAVSGEISKISNLIKNHVQSYYHSKSVNPGLIDNDDLQQLGSDLPVSVGTLSALLGNAATREIALRFCIAWVVTSRSRLHDSPATTFLPLELSECLQSMLSAEQSSRTHTTYFAKWRVISADLMRSAYVQNAFSANDSRVHNIRVAASVLDNVLRPYTDSRMDNGQRSRNLEEILKRAAQFAFTLFSQPTGWDFDWDNDQDVKSGSICIFPALVQTSDEEGKSIRPPRPFSEPVVRRLDE
ncbi:hypothetical protein CC80DRAFT_418382 [Byssothecium circinans]|uniref:Uncharacterized protein n=1 Tax=Byssothecium circinans TaxID=147558 RepID=A0A6A5TQE7_9PLEO|nr:hypothetical protein CC80DRAFT_418382 [Byssothecium circinans]